MKLHLNVLSPFQFFQRSSKCFECQRIIPEWRPTLRAPLHNFTFCRTFSWSLSSAVHCITNRCYTVHGYSLPFAPIPNNMTLCKLWAVSTVRHWGRVVLQSWGWQFRVQGCYCFANRCHFHRHHVDSMLPNPNEWFEDLRHLWCLWNPQTVRLVNPRLQQPMEHELVWG